MKTKFAGSHHQSPLEQLYRNKTLWIGHMDSGAVDHLAGQTFNCPQEGQLKEIQVYSAEVSHPGKVVLTVHEFDGENKRWGPVISTSEIEVDKSDNESWMHFQLPGTAIHKDAAYGFRLKSDDALVAIGEAAWSGEVPPDVGDEWCISNFDNKEHYYHYFSLAFKVALRA